LEFDAGATYREWVARLRDAVEEFAEHSMIPQPLLQHGLAKRGVALPLPPVLFQARYPLPTMEFGGLRMTALPRHCVNPAGFEIGVTRRGEATLCWAVFEPRRIDPQGVDAFLADLALMSTAVGTEPDRPLIELLPPPAT
jgi:hypothetical protein